MRAAVKDTSCIMDGLYHMCEKQLQWNSNPTKCILILGITQYIFCPPCVGKRSSPSCRFFSYFEASRANRRHILEMGPQEMKFPSTLKYLNPVSFSFHPAKPSYPPPAPQTDNKFLPPVCFVYLAQKKKCATFGSFRVKYQLRTLLAPQGFISKFHRKVRCWSFPRFNLCCHKNREIRCKKTKHKEIGKFLWLVQEKRKWNGNTVRYLITDECRSIIHLKTRTSHRTCCDKQIHKRWKYPYFSSDVSLERALTWMETTCFTHWGGRLTSRDPLLLDNLHWELYFTTQLNPFQPLGPLNITNTVFFHNNCYDHKGVLISIE